MYELYIYHISPKGGDELSKTRVIKEIESYCADEFSTIYNYAIKRGMSLKRLNRVNDKFIEDLNKEEEVGEEEKKNFFYILLHRLPYETGLFFNIYKDGALLEFEHETGFPRGMVLPQKKKTYKRGPRGTVLGDDAGSSFLKSVSKEKAQIDWEIQECKEYVPNITKQWKNSYADYEIGNRRFDSHPRSRRSGSWKNQKKRKQWM